MKKIIVFMLSLLVLLSGCNSAPAENVTESTIAQTALIETSEPNVEMNTEPETKPTLPETESPQTYPETGVYGGFIVLGNITFAIPEDFIVTVVDENSYVLSPSDGLGNCAIAIAAFDVSILDENSTKNYLKTINESMVDFGDDIVVPSDEDIIAEIGEMEVHLRACGTSDGYNMIFHADATFTDSWYAYTIIYKYDMESEKSSEYNNIFITFTLSSVHNGKEPRFDFIQ